MTMNPKQMLEPERLKDLVARALKEDIQDGDVTSNTLVPSDIRVRAAILAREAGVSAGAPVALDVFRQVDPHLTLEVLIEDGGTVTPDDRIMLIEGSARSILTAERTALNFMQRLSGIATQTREYVNRVQSHGVMILDTRKTTPTLRMLEKYAVHCGGGVNHRMGLYDRVMIKDNHRALGAWSLAEAIRKVRRDAPGIVVEVEVETFEELEDALTETPEWILLDNMPPQKLREYVAHCGGRVKTEASGGITLDTLDAVAATGVDAISLGCLTHSVNSLDLSLEIMETLT